MDHRIWLGIIAVAALCGGPGLAHDPAVGERAGTRAARVQPSAGVGGEPAPTGQNTAEAEGAHEHEVETENLFGFTIGSDTDKAGTRTLAVENVFRTGKRIGVYRALGQKLEFGLGLTDDLNVSMGLLGDYHRVRNIPDFDDVRGRYAFRGFGGEIRWRFMNREQGPFGLTLQLEPSITRIDEESGLAGRQVGSENKLIFDKELVPEKLFGALNLIYDLERVRERGAMATERESKAGIAAALSYQVAPKIFLGAEARYLRAYEGLGLGRYEGDALYLGPTFYTQLQPNAWLSASWNIQVTGREAIDRRERATAVVEGLNAIQTALDAGEEPPALELPRRRGRLNLANFERHQFRLKVGFEF